MKKKANYEQLSGLFKDIIGTIQQSNFKISNYSRTLRGIIFLPRIAGLSGCSPSIAAVAAQVEVAIGKRSGSRWTHLV